MPFTPKELLDSIPEEKRLTRLYAMVRIYDDLCAKRWPGTILNKDVLLHCVESYFCDILRVKAFHDVDLANQHKRAAFTIKWVARARPIQLRPNAQTTKATVLANEVFALLCGLSHLQADINDISPAFQRNLLYTLHYRNLDGEVLTSLMYAIECALLSRKP